MSEPNQWPPPGCPPIDQALHTLANTLANIHLNLRLGKDGGLWVDLAGWSFLVTHTSDGFEIVDHVAPETPEEAVFFQVHTRNLPLILEAFQEVGMGAHQGVRPLQEKLLGRPLPWNIQIKFLRTDETLGKVAAAFGRRGVLFAIMPWAGGRG